LLYKIWKGYLENTEVICFDGLIGPKSQGGARKMNSLPLLFQGKGNAEGAILDNCERNNKM
jgi:hypothetical protein